MKKIEKVDNKLNVELKSGDVLEVHYKETISFYEYKKSLSNGEHLIKRIKVDRTKLLYFIVSKSWFCKKGIEVYLI